MIAKEPGINWCWYLDYDITNPNEIIIRKHWRLHYQCNDHPKTTLKFQLITNEQDRRIVIGAKIGQAALFTFKVINPRYIFDYV